MTVMVGQNAVLALGRLWIKVHQMLRECDEHFVVKKFFFPLAVARSPFEDICAYTSSQNYFYEICADLY